MKKIISVLTLVIIASVLSGCVQKDNSRSRDEIVAEMENIIFTAVIEEVSENNLIVTAEDVGFDNASVNIAELEDINFELLVGQRVEIEITPEIMESDPVQVTAVSIIAEEAEYKKITAQQAKEMMSGEVIILDVRTKEEYNEGHIEDAILIPNTNITDLAPEMLTDTSATILVYCRSGNRSQTAAKNLIEMGYQNVYDFGGINDWTYEVVTP